MIPRLIILDTFPLSSVAKPGPRTGASPGVSDVCREWVRECLRECLRAGHQVIAPAICYYEALRELERLNASQQIQRLREFCFSRPGRFLSLTDAHLEQAARLWAQARNAGTPTASADALDGDVLLAAQALSLAVPTQQILVATTNVGHLSQFVPADLWTNIAP